MSIKALHISFVVLTTLLALGLGGLSLAGYARHGETGSLVMGIGGLLTGGLLIVYFRSMMRKLRNVSLL